MDCNPAAGVRVPKVLFVEQTQVLLDRPGLPVPRTAVKRHDQAMFEILYSSDLRPAELVSLD